MKGKKKKMKKDEEDSRQRISERKIAERNRTKKKNLKLNKGHPNRQCPTTTHHFSKVRNGILIPKEQGITGAEALCGGLC